MSDITNINQEVDMFNWRISSCAYLTSVLAKYKNYISTIDELKQRGIKPTEQMLSYVKDCENLFKVVLETSSQLGLSAYHYEHGDN